MPAEAASRRQVALLPNLRAHRLAALRGVRAPYYEYAPRVKRAAALLDGPFGKTQGMLFLNIPPQEGLALS